MVLLTTHQSCSLCLWSRRQPTSTSSAPARQQRLSTTATASSAHHGAGAGPLEDMLTLPGTISWQVSNVRRLSPRRPRTPHPGTRGPRPSEIINIHIGTGASLWPPINAHCSCSCWSRFSRNLLSFVNINMITLKVSPLIANLCFLKSLKINITRRFANPAAALCSIRRP